MDGGDGDVAGAHGVEIGAGAGVLLGAGRADPPHRPAARINLLDARFGAVAVAESDHNVIYVGTGEAPIRGVTTSHGDGMYKSTDAGRTWSHIGLKETKFIGGIVVHPTDPDLVYVAALGDVFGPNKDRGVYRSKDGGKTWQKVFYRSDVAGAVKISMDRKNPRILFAAVWEAKRNFWNISSGGPGSGLFLSPAGGDLAGRSQDYLRRFADAQSVLDARLDAAGIRHARHYTDQPLDLPLRRLFGARDAAEYA